MAGASSLARDVPESGKDLRPKKAASHSGRLLVRMPATLHDELANAAETEGVSLNQFITSALADAVEWKQDDEPGSRRKRPWQSSAEPHDVARACREPDCRGHRRSRGDHAPGRRLAAGLVAARQPNTGSCRARFSDLQPFSSRQAASPVRSDDGPDDAGALAGSAPGEARPRPASDRFGRADSHDDVSGTGGLGGAAPQARCELDPRRARSSRSRARNRRRRMERNS